MGRILKALVTVVVLCGLVAGCSSFGPTNPNALTQFKRYDGKPQWQYPFGTLRGVASATNQDTVMNGEIELLAVRFPNRTYPRESDYNVALAVAGHIKRGDLVDCLFDGIAHMTLNGRPVGGDRVLLCKKAD